LYCGKGPIYRPQTTSDPIPYSYKITFLITIKSLISILYEKLSEIIIINK